MQTLPQTLADVEASQTADSMGVPQAEAIHDRSLEFENLIAHELPRFQNMAMRWLQNREDAEDAVQDAVLSAFIHIASFEGRARMSSWLMSIVINSVKMQLRKRRQKMVPLDQLLEDGSRTVAEMIPDLGPNPEQSCQRSELREILEHSIGRLSATQRTALQLFEFGGLALKEVAQKLGVPVGTVKAQLARGRGQLARKLKKALGSHTCSCRIESVAIRRPLKKPTRSLAALQPAHNSDFLARGKERLARDRARKEPIPADTCFTVMEVAVEGSPVPA